MIKNINDNLFKLERVRSTPVRMKVVKQYAENTIDMIRKYNSIKKDIIIKEQTLNKHNSDEDIDTNTQSINDQNQHDNTEENQQDIEGIELITCEKKIKEFRKLSTN